MNTSDADLRAAAAVWAAATGRRDGRERSPAEVRPGIERALSTPGAALRMAWSDGEPVGFVLVVRAADALEVRYLGVAPTAWGQGVATRLLADVVALANGAAVSRLELWVLRDNARAIAVYERSGWHRTGDLKSQIDTHRVEERLEKRLGQDTDDPGRGEASTGPGITPPA